MIAGQLRERVRTSLASIRLNLRWAWPRHVWLWTAVASCVFALGVLAADLLGWLGHLLILSHAVAVALPAFRLGRRGAWGGALMSGLAFTAADSAYNALRGRSSDTPADLLFVGLTSLALAVLFGELGQALQRQRALTERARRSEQRFNNVFNSLPSGLVALTPAGRIALANDRAVELLQRPLEQLLGADLRRLVPEAEWPRLREAIAQHQPGPSMRIPMVGPDGRRRRMGCVFSPYVEGEQTGTLMYFQDDETAIKREAETTTLAAAVSSLSEGVVLVDLEGRIRFANQAMATIYGFESPRLLTGRPVRDFLGASSAGFEERMTRSRMIGYAYEGVVRRDGGEEIPVHVTTSPVRIDGELIGTIGVVTDLTEQREIANRAAIADKLATLGRLVAGAAHEINNPLAAILSHAELLQLEGPSPRDQDGSVDIIAREARRAGRIVRDLLSFARQNPVTKADLQLQRVVDDVVAMRAAYIRSSGIDLHVVGEAGDIVVRADEDQLKQVLLNLLVNAEYAVSDGQEHRVRLRVTRVGATALVILDDSGSGVPEDLRQRVFEPFFTTKPGTQGTGLGLSVSYGIVQEHGGHIWVERSPLGGARFVVQLPLVGDAGAVPPPPAATGPGRVMPRRVLLVDDEPSIRRAAERILRRDGHTVEAAGDGAQALALARHHAFDVIICDLRMPVMSGPDCYAAMKREGLLRDAAFIVTTGDVADAQSFEFVQAEALPVLLKPFDMDSLLSIVSSTGVETARVGV